MSKILIVDDHQENIEYLKAQLHEFDLLEANNGRAALKKVLEDKPDLILLDVMMPGIDGYTVLSIVKNSPATRIIPVIMLTASNEIDDPMKFHERGAEDSISEPFHKKELLEKIKTLLHVKELRDQVAETQQVLISLVQAMEDKNMYYRGHCQRTADYAVKLARKELLQPARQEQIRTAALLHDIGKIGIPEMLYFKDGQLTGEELEIVKKHSVLGEQFCSSLTALKPMLPFIRYHHERYDGTGYPDGLKGRDIPLGARIIAVADGYDALTSERPYRKAFSPEDAVVILRANSGSQWTPELVELFCQLVEGGTLHSE